MKNKNIHLKTTLFMALLGFHTFGSCTSTQQALGVENRRYERSCCSRPSWLTWGDFRRKMHTHPKKCWSIIYLGTTTFLCTAGGLLYYFITSTSPGNHLICGGFDMSPISKLQSGGLSTTNTPDSIIKTPVPVDDYYAQLKAAFKQHINKYGTESCTFEEISQAINSKILELDTFDKWIEENVNENNVNTLKDNSGRTPLMLVLALESEADQSTKEKIVKSLIDKGAATDESVKDKNGKTIIEYTKDTTQEDTRIKELINENNQKSTTQKDTTEKSTTEKGTTEKGTTEKSTTEKGTTEK